MDKNELFQKIINCENVKAHYLNIDKCNPCSEIIKTQKCKEIENYQLPEPWSGDVENAPILFISSNPSISKKEFYPDHTWDPHKIQEFFYNRFGNDERKSWVYELKVLNKNNKRERKYVRYWASIKKRAAELLDKDPIPGQHYCLTEIVHCKSRKQKGVESAVDTCKELYLNNILRISKAKVIVGIGKLAKESLQSHFNSDAKLIEVGKRIIVFLPHPNARSRSKTILKKFNDNYNKVYLEKIKDHLKEWKKIKFGAQNLPTL